MFRQLVGLVLLSLAAFGLSPAQAETFYPYAGAPKVEVYAVDFDDTTNLQPAVSSGGSRTSYTIRVDALTNGSLDEIEVIALCFYSAGNVDGNLYDDDHCGYQTDAATRSGKLDPPATNDPAHFFTAAWTTDSTFRKDGTNQHTLDDASTSSTFIATRVVGTETVTFSVQRVDFKFQLSHAAVNTSDWQIRAVAVTTPSPYNSEAVSSVASRHIYSGSCSNSYSDGNQLSGDAARSVNPSCVTPVQFGVNFFGGFVSSTVRDSVAYGEISEGGSSTKTGLTTADYYSNDIASISIAASSFGHDANADNIADDTIPLTEGGTFGQAVSGREMALDCTGDPTASGETVRVGSTAKLLFDGIPASSSQNDSESEISAPTHECQLFYGFGARYANSIYTNTVTLGIFDGDTTNGPSSVGLYEAVETFTSQDLSNTSSDETTRSTSDAAIRP